MSHPFVRHAQTALRVRNFRPTRAFDFTRLRYLARAVARSDRWDQLVAEREALEAELAQWDQVHSELHAEVRKLDARVEQILQYIRQEKAREDMLRRDIAAVQQKLAAEYFDAAALEKEKRSFPPALDQDRLDRDLLAELEAELRDTLRRIEHYETELLHLQMEREGALENIAVLERELRDVRDLIAERAQVVKEADDMRRTLRRKIDQNENQLWKLV